MRVIAPEAPLFEGIDLASANPNTNANRRAAEALDPSALMQIKSLSLRAKAVVEGYTSGIHRSSGFFSDGGFDYLGFESR